METMEEKKKKKKAEEDKYDDGDDRKADTIARKFSPFDFIMKKRKEQNKIRKDIMKEI